MITKNFDAIQRTLIFGRIWPTGITKESNLTEEHYLQDNNTVVKVSSPTSTTYTPRLRSYASATGYRLKYGAKSCISYLSLGVQNSIDEEITPESYYDYQMTHLWTSAPLTATPSESIQVEYYTENGINYLHISRMFTNTSGETKLVREIGVYMTVWIDPSTESSCDYLLIYRKVLPNYVEVAPNGTYSVDIKIPMTELAPNKPATA